MPNTDLQNIQQATLLKSGNSFFEKLLQLIEQATNEIHLQTYIFENDTTGKKVIASLISVAKRGVKVYVLVDAFGSKSLTNELMNDLKETGINIRKFSPATGLLKLPFGKRLHQKVLVVDYQHCIIGGINIADRYSGWDHQLPWLDYAVYFTGKACLRAQRICAKLYFKQKANPLTSIRRKLKRFIVPKTSQTFTVAFNDWYRQRFEISGSYRQALRDVKTEAVFLASYFLPSIRIMRLLKKASKRGVNISIAIPSATDVPALGYTSKYLYRWLLRRNISVYEYNPGMLHAKCALMDNSFLTVGSFNLISLSEYGSVEMNVNISNHDVVKQASIEFRDLLKTQCRKINASDLTSRSLYSRFKDWLAFHSIRAAMRLYLFFSSDEES